jgi:hypothetical protein
MGASAISRERLSRAVFATLAAPAVGLEVAHTWQGYGSAVFLELGRLRRVRGQTNPWGEFSVMVEWSWRVESARRVQFGSWSRDRRIASGVASLAGRTVTELGVEGRLPELVVGLSGGRWLRSFMTAEGQPHWTLFLPSRDWVCVQRGVLVRSGKPR